MLKYSLYGVYLWDLDFATSPIPQLWTIKFELIGSFGILLLLLLTGRSSWRWLAYLAALAGTLLFTTYYATFILGVILADLYLSPRVTQARARLGILPGCALIGVIVLVYFSQPQISSFIIIAAGIVFFSMLSRNACHFLSNRLSVFLAKISFPLYITHGLVIFCLGPRLIPLVDSPTGILFVNLAIVITSLAVARSLQFMDTLGMKAASAAGATVVKHLPALNAKRRIGGDCVR